MKKNALVRRFFYVVIVGSLFFSSCEIATPGDSGTSTTISTTTTTTLPPFNPDPTVYFVSPSGSDNASGKSSGVPFKTLKKAAGLTLPGDTVRIMPGTYTSNSMGSVLNITRSGNASQRIIYTAYDPSNKPKLSATGDVWNVVIINASYITFDQIEIEGDRAALTLEGAQASYDDAYSGSKNNWSRYSQYNTNGISVGGPKQDSKLPHHVTISNCIVRDMPGGGISSIQADYTVIEGNEVYNNAWWMMYGGSGISILHPYNSDGYTGTKNIVKKNRVYNNKTLIFWIGLNRRSDGNGIIIDINESSYAGGVAPDNAPYGGRTLVENNVAYYNGGSGIHAYRANHVDILNNTAYKNGTEVGYHDIFLNDSDDSKLMNNVIYARTYVPASDPFPDNPSPWWISTSPTSPNTGSVYDYNLYYNVTINQSSTPGAGKGINSVYGLDPKFVSVPAEPASNTSAVGPADFRIQSDSPAKNAGGSSAALHDILGTSRPQGGAIDIGAYESF